MEPPTDAAIPRNSGFNIANAATLWLKYRLPAMPASVTWLKASAISDKRLTTMNTPRSGAMTPMMMQAANAFCKN